MATNDARRNRRASNFSVEETLALLKIWREPEMRDKVAAIARDKKAVWDEIATLLHDKGYPVRGGFRAGEQIHAKIKGLRNRYNTLHFRSVIPGHKLIGYTMSDITCYCRLSGQAGGLVEIF